MHFAVTFIAIVIVVSRSGRAERSAASVNYVSTQFWLVERCSSNKDNDDDDADNPNDGLFS